MTITLHKDIFTIVVQDGQFQQIREHQMTPNHEK